MVIFDYLVKKDKWADVKKEAQKQMPIIKKLNHLSWFKLNYECPILDKDTKKCKAYTVRPVKCSTHFTESPAAVCDPWSVSAEKFIPLDMTDIEEEFEKKLYENINDFGIFKIELPIPIAILFAERISQKSNQTFNQVISMIRNEFK